ncbi:MAG: hypothetical protein HY905_14870 [Deltaproteobacteria bacterium]|nr:hypothetical protein [Deltaproteobacteria bacterium]
MRTGLFPALALVAAELPPGAGCTSGADPRDATESCVQETCVAQCLADGGRFPRCSDGGCVCLSNGLDCCVMDDGGRPEDAAEDAAEDAPECLVPVPVEVRPGASPGVACTRVSISTVEDGLLSYDGDGRSVVFVGTDHPPQPLWAFDRTSRCLSLLDDLSETAEPYTHALDPSLDGMDVAYAVQWTGTDNSVWNWQLRLARNLVRPTYRVLDEMLGPRDREPRMDFVSLDSPWVVWRDIRQSNGYHWDAFALNIDTDERRNLSLDPVTEERRWGSVVKVDLLDTVAVFDYGAGGGSEPLVLEIVSVDLTTGVYTQITDAPAQQCYPTITPHWIAWIDQRNHPDLPCTWPFGCSADIFGYNRDTGATQALVVAGESCQGPTLDGEGDWIAYDDQRDGTDVTMSLDREEDIYALHLPTMTEVRITDWPGFEMRPRVVDRGDGTYSVLLVEELDYGGALYRLWDCTLPEFP